MSEHFAIVVRLDDVIPIDGTDNLAQTMVLGYPVVVRKDEFEKYQKAVFVPPGNIVNGIKVKAKKIRGVLSMGMLLSASVEWPEGLDVAKQLGLKRIEEDFELATECEKAQIGLSNTQTSKHIDGIQAS